MGWFGRRGGLSAAPRRKTAHRASLGFEPLEDRWVLALAHAADGFSQGLLHTEADFDRMATKVAEQAQPWYSGYQALTSEGYAQLGTNPRPLETVIRGGDGSNYAQMHIDIQRAYLLAVRWKVTGDTAYADKAVEFLNAWQYTMTNLTGNADRFLAAGLYGYEWANVAEIMRTYEGWSETDAQNFGDWLITHYYAKNHDFLVNHNNAAITNYWANWDLANIAGMLAIGIYTDRQDIHDEAVDYLYNGGGNGALDRMVYYVHDGNLGQWQESGRDQGHTTLGISIAGPIMQMAWNQGLDFFAYDNNRFLAGAEYVAKYNSWEEVPYTTYNWGTGQNGTWQTQPSVSGAGRGSYRPGYELVYNHYANIKGIAAPWSEHIVDTHNPEGWSRNGDQFGFGTLLYTLDAYPAAESKPSGLTAVNYDGTVKLNWWGALYADSHNVYRATSENGVFELIASGIDDLQTYTDHGMPSGEYFYKVTGVIDGVETAASDTVSIDTSPGLIVHLTFDESSGTTAADSTGNNVTGELHNGATWVAGKTGNAVDLSGSGQYVSLPDSVTEKVSDYTIATWVKLDTLSTWSRIFDFGNTDGRYMYLTPRAGSGKVHFGLTTNYGYVENVIEGNAALPTGQWVHVAISQEGRVGRLYVNGVVVGTNGDMPLNAFQLGSTDNTWIGRSQYGNDPYLNGQVDDFRIYSGALTTGEIYEMAMGQPAPATPAAPTEVIATAQVGNSVALSWRNARGSSSNTIKRATSPDGPFQTIAAGVTGVSYTDTNLVAGQTYYYVIYAVNNGGNSDPSAVVSAVTLPPLPGAAANFLASPISATEVQLNWDAASNATSYTVSRSDTSGGPYAVIASGVATTSYTDTPPQVGTTYYYVVTAENAAGLGAPSAEASATTSDLRGWWRFDEAIGAVAADSSGSAGDAAVVGGAVWSAGRVEGALQLDGVDDYVDLPDGVVAGLTEFSISLWTKPGTNSNWARLFDFGTGTNNFMFLTPKNGTDGDLRFEIVTGGVTQRIETSTALSNRGWSHVVVTLKNGVGILYVNGVEVGRNNAMTLTPGDLGVTTQNYIGDSQWSADPYYSGLIDDFRILNRALSAADIQAMSASLPTLEGDYNRDGAVNAGDYTVWRDARGTFVPAFSGADGSGDGYVDPSDWDLWKANYGATASTATFATIIAAEVEKSPAVEATNLEATIGLALSSSPVRSAYRPALASTLANHSVTGTRDAAIALLLLDAYDDDLLASQELMDLVVDDRSNDEEAWIDEVWIDEAEPVEWASFVSAL
jgi:fibronectin type 3 domain-containing protein